MILGYKYFIKYIIEVVGDSPCRQRVTVIAALVLLYLSICRQEQWYPVTFWPKVNSEDQLFWGSRPERREVVVLWLNVGLLLM